jgi:deoxyribonuclease-4
MLIGAHVSTAGGLYRSVERGIERGCRAIQIFNQSPRMWRPTAYGDADFAAFGEALAGSGIGAVVIHAVYLINCAAEDRTVRAKSLVSLTHSLRVGASIGARGVVVHPGSAKTGDVPRAIARAGKTIAAALADSEGCPLLLENTAGAGGTLGRSIAELASLLEASGGDGRLGICLDSCHLFASGYDVRATTGVDELVVEVAAQVGLERLGCLHLNDSQAPLASNRDRHANIGEGELGERGCAAFLGHPAFQSLPCVLETRGDGHGPSAAEVALTMKLQRRGESARRRARKAAPGRGAGARKAR